jgi:hypothetical protein
VPQAREARHLAVIRNAAAVVNVPSEDTRHAPPFTCSFAFWRELGKWAPDVASIHGRHADSVKGGSASDAARTTSRWSVVIWGRRPIGHTD